MIKLFNSPILGMCITDTSDKKMYLFNRDKSKYQIVSSDEMDEIYKEYKYVNTLNTPFCVLVYGQVFKNRNYGLNQLSERISQEELNAILSNKELIIL